MSGPVTLEVAEFQRGSVLAPVRPAVDCLADFPAAAPTADRASLGALRPASQSLQNFNLTYNGVVTTMFQGRPGARRRVFRTEMDNLLRHKQRLRIVIRLAPSTIRFRTPMTMGNASGDIA